MYVKVVYLTKWMNILLKFVQQWCKGETALGAMASPTRKLLPFSKEYQNKVVIFVFLRLKVCPALEKCYYLIILLKTFIRAA